jgi:hypothetical protein
LTLLSWLLPLITLIVAGFVVSLPFTGLKTLWGIGHASALLLVATAALVVLINAAHQDGEPEHLPPNLLRLSARVAAILPVPLTLIAAYALFLRVEQHGWSVLRVMLAANVIAALGYAGGYAWAAVKPGAWLEAIKTWNFGMALLILAEIVALFTPVASPARIAVADQMARLNSGKTPPQTFDYTFLRWEGGRYGMEALQGLAARGDAHVRKMAQLALNQTSRYSSPIIATSAIVSRLAVYPAGAKLPQSFVQMDWNKEGRPMMRPNCPLNRTCDAIVADLDGDGRPEILIDPQLGQFAQVFREDERGVWTQAGTLQLPFRCPAVMEALRQGHFEMRPPSFRWNDIQIGALRLHVQGDVNLFGPPKCPS